MHKGNALLFIPLIEAFAAGKTIQFNDTRDNWVDMDSKYGIAWTHVPEKYRIKPDPPQEILVYSIHEDGSISGYTPDSRYLRNMQDRNIPWSKNKPRKFIEVIEE